MRAIIRVEHDKNRPFLMVSVDTVRDKSLSFESRGFLMYLLAKPDTWRIRVDELAKETGYHRATIYRMLQKLIDVKYVRRVDIKRRNGDGTIFQSASLYTVYESRDTARQEDELDRTPF